MMVNIYRLQGSSEETWVSTVRTRFGAGLQVQLTAAGGMC